MSSTVEHLVYCHKLTTWYLPFKETNKIISLDTNANHSFVDDVLHGNKSGGYIIPGHNGGTLQVDVHHLGDKTQPGGVEPTIRIDDVVAKRRRRATDDGKCLLYKIFIP